MNTKIDSNIIRKIASIVGKNNYSTDFEDRLCYSYDATKQSSLPAIVVKPHTTEEISTLMQLAYENNIPVYPRGAGSGLTGGSVPSKGGIVLNLCEMNNILEIDKENLIAVLEPGVVLADFQLEVEKLGLLYPPDPASDAMATIGGNVAECAGGLRCLKYGVTRDYILGLEVVLPNGDVINTGVRTLKGVTGYDLTRLLIGSEGTLGIFTKIIVKLIPLPKSALTFLALYKNVSDAVASVQSIIDTRIIPRTLELIDEVCFQAVQKYKKKKYPEEAKAVLLVEIDGEEAAIQAQKEKIINACKKNNAYEVITTQNQEQRDELWELRKSVSPALYSISQKKINEDICVPRSKLTAMFSRIDEISKKYNLTMAKFGHAGDGNIHINVLIEKEDPEILKRAEHAIEEIFNETLALGGTLSGEHGIGNTKSAYLHLEIHEKELQLMKNLKELFDPKGILNPGKIFP